MADYFIKSFYSLGRLFSVRVLFVLGILLSISGVVEAQEIGITNRVSTRKVIQPSSPKSKTVVKTVVRETVKVVYKEKYVTKETTTLIKPTGLTVTIQPNASIALESLKSGSKFQKVDKANTSGFLTFENLPPGKYKLSASLDGFESQEAEINIVSQKILTIPITLKKLTYDFSIQANVTAGEVRFAPVTIQKENSDGTLEVKETGGFCMVPIIDGKAIIKEMPKGAYLLDVRAKEVEYQAETAVIKIPENIETASDTGAVESFSINLDKKLSTETFSNLETADAWVLPAGWKLEGKKLRVETAGIALPKSDSYRFYKDFQLEATVRLLNDTAVGFVIHALDDKNYYLIQLTGAASSEPYIISGFIVKNGKPERIFANPISFLAKTIGNKQFFSVVIKGKGNVFRVFVEDSQTGDQIPLGNVVFKDDNFPIGAIGLGTKDNAGFEVGRFTICTPECK